MRHSALVDSVLLTRLQCSEGADQATEFGFRDTIRRAAGIQTKRARSLLRHIKNHVHRKAVPVSFASYGTGPTTTSC